MGFALGSVAGVFAFGLMVSLESSAIPQSTLCIAVLAPIAYLTWWLRQRTPDLSIPAPTAPAPSRAHDDSMPRPLHWSEKPIPDHPSPAATASVDTAAIAAVRIQSFEAMTRAAEARKRDMDAHGERSSESVGFSDIEFNYRDAEGNESHRRVDVWGGEGDHFEGWCHKARGFRTFVVGRVLGDVLDRETGELMTARQWADMARVHPLNVGLIEERRPSPKAGRKRQSARKWETAAYFVGFREGRRAELEDLADAAGWQVRQRFSDTLDVLVAGSLAGKSQLTKAEEMGIEVISEEDFRDRV